MKFAILIITHTSPKQTKRIIDNLNNGQFDFYIHVDNKIDIETHRDMFNMPGVYFINNRFDVKWGGYSAIQSTISGIRQIAASGIQYDFINLMSGQDYPIKSASSISHFLSENVGKQFILYRNMDKDWTIAKRRVEKYHFTDATFIGKHMVESLVNLLAPSRKFPINIELYGKEVYWSLSMECAIYVADFIDTHPKLNRFLKYTWGADEFVFHSIIMNSPFKNSVVNKNYRYMVWPPHESRPKVLITEDYNDIIASDALFARKFDINVDENILDLIDNNNNYYK